jgi:nucleoside-diphosphate-sugar epimerase
VIGIYGARGWVGSALAAEALRRRYTVRCFARRGGSGVVAVSAEPSTDELIRAFEGLSGLVNVAGVAHVAGAPDPAGIFANAALPARIAIAAGKAGVPRVVHLSSIKACGGSGHIEEQGTPEPTDAYGRSKLIGDEQAISALPDGVALSVVRPPLILGTAAPGNFGRLVRAVARGRVIPLPAPYPRRSVLLRSNLLDLLFHLAHEGSGIRVVQIADAAPTTAELVHLVAEAMGRACRVLPVPARPVVKVLRLVGRHDDAVRLVAPFTLRPSSQAEMQGWVAPQDLRQGLLHELGATP